jgi:FeS assembly SUF system regulator
MLKLSRLTDYAVAALVRLSAAQGVETSPGIAASIGVPEPTVAKVLKALAGQGLVISTRGARGGYRLGRRLAEVSVAEVICAIDGPIALTSCVEGATGFCDSQPLCPVAGRWDPVNEAIRAALSKISLAEMAAAALPPGLRLPDPMNEVA